MKLLRYILGLPNQFIKQAQRVDFLAPLALRLYLVPIFWMAGTQKLQHIENTAAWFGNPDWGLGLPFPYFLAYAAGTIEALGAILLLLGLGVRWISLPLSFVMFVALFSVHLDNGWPVIASNSHEATIRLNGFLEWLQQNYPQRHQYITALGRPVVLNNGIEFTVTYLIMLVSLFFSGAGKYVSLDYWIDKKVNKS